MQTLQNVTLRFSPEVYAGLTALSPSPRVASPPRAANQGPSKTLSLASHLPQKLFSQYLSLLTPTLDLSASGLCHSQLMCVAMSLQDLLPCPGLLLSLIHI